MSPKSQESRTITSESSQKLVDFLESADLHKKDFAEMIGVTLSYVYSLTDNTISFSTRTPTLERIALVMNIPPEEFAEYRASEEPKMIDPGVQFLKEKQGKLGINNLQLIKRFPRNKRVEIVDLWRGAEPLPLDWKYLSTIAEILEISSKEIYPYWQARMQQYLTMGGIDYISNNRLLDAMFEGARKYLKI